MSVFLSFEFVHTVPQGFLGCLGGAGLKDTSYGNDIKQLRFYISDDDGLHSHGINLGKSTLSESS